MEMDSKPQFKNGLITFDESAQEWILSAFGISVDKGGYLVKTAHPETRVITPNGEEILIEEFAGIRKSKTGTGMGDPQMTAYKPELRSIPLTFIDCEDCADGLVRRFCRKIAMCPCILIRNEKRCPRGFP